MDSKICVRNLRYCEGELVFISIINDYRNTNIQSESRIIDKHALRGDREGHAPRASIVRIYFGAFDLSITFFVIGNYNTA